MKQVICHRATSVPTTSNWLGAFGHVHVSSAESQAQSPWLPPGTFSLFRVRLDTAPGSGTSWAITLYKNGVATSVTVTIADTATEATDSSNTVTVAAGDYFALRWVATGAVAAPGGMTYSIEFDGDNAAESGYSQAMSTLSTTLTQYTGVFSPTNQGSSYDTWQRTAAAADIATILPTSGTITGLHFRINGSPGGGTKAYNCAIYKALAATPTTFVKQDGAGGTVDTRVSCANTTVSATATFSLTVAAGDRVYIECVPVDTPTLRMGAVAVAFTADTDGESIVSGYAYIQMANNVTSYMPATGTAEYYASESGAEVVSNPSPFSLSKLHAAIDTAPGTDNSWTVQLRRNQSLPSGSLTVVFEDASEYERDLTHSVAVNDGDEWNLVIIPASNPSLAMARWSMVQTPLSPQIRGSFVAGENTTVNVSRATAWGLDGNANVHDEEGVHKIFGASSVTEYVEQAEMASAPAAPAGATKKVRIWAEQSGGKTRWMAQFATGSPVQLSIEP